MADQINSTPRVVIDHFFTRAMDSNSRRALGALVAAPARDGSPPSRPEQLAASVPAASCFPYPDPPKIFLLVPLTRDGTRSRVDGRLLRRGRLPPGRLRDRRGNGGGPGGRARWQSTYRPHGRVAVEWKDGADGRGDAAPRDEDEAGQAHADEQHDRE